MSASRKTILVAFLAGAAITIIALVGWRILALPGLHKVVVDTANTGAWIGFWGSIIGSGIALAAAAIAIIPAYQQVGEARRASAVQAGQVLRSRYVAVKGEVDIALLATGVSELDDLLALDRPDISREQWLVVHQDRASRIRDRMLPRLDDILTRLILRGMGIELPDLERGRYIEAVQQMSQRMAAVLDGLPRQDNGGVGEPLSSAQWRDHLEATKAYGRDEVAPAALEYNNNINLAMQALRRQIYLSDRASMGKSASADFDRSQKFTQAIRDTQQTAN